MEYDFTQIPNRFDSYSLKWHVGAHELPMWVADMDFKIAPEILQALQKVLNHGIFGYSTIPLEYYESIMQWWQTRYNFIIQKEWILYSTGVMPAISSIIRTMSSVGDNILVQSPVYHVFYRCIEENGRHVVSNKLLLKNKVYSIDFEDLEQKLRDEKTTMMILCNPHNPIGKVWEKDVLERIGSLCERYNVLVIADEIHCDITHEKSYTPFASINEQCANSSISTFSPSKTFNIADLHVASTVIPNRTLRQKIQKSFAIDYVGNPNAFGIAASIAAYQYGQKWLKTALHYIVENKKITQDFIHTHLPNLHVIDSHATYLLWIDCSEYVQNTDKFCAFLRKHTGLYVSNGSSFGAGGESFFRLNIACPKTTLLDGLQRLQQGITHFINLL